MEVSLERLIEAVIREIVAELSKRGVTLASNPENRGSTDFPASQKRLTEIIDLKSYKSPVLTENHLASLELGVREIVLPRGTVITPGAREIISKRKLIIRSENKTN